MYLKFLGVTAITLLLSSCANMSKSDCLTADWQTIGFEDGSFGRNQSNITTHRQECSKHGVTPDLSEYRNGHFEGSKQFCTISNGFSRGKRGKSYNRSCPQQFEAEFLTGFSDGQSLYALKKVLQQHTSALEDAYSEIKSLDREMAKNSNLMIADGLNREQRIEIREEIEYQQQQQMELYDLLPHLKQDFEDSLQAYEQGVDKFSDYL